MFAPISRITSAIKFFTPYFCDKILMCENLDRISQQLADQQVKLCSVSCHKPISVLAHHKACLSLPLYHSLSTILADTYDSICSQT